MQKILFIFFVTLFSCNTSETTTPDEFKKNEVMDKKIQSKSPIDFTGCYLRLMNNDSLIATLKQNGNQIAGKLYFRNYQIDGSVGNVKGIVEDSIIKLKYRFTSEGMKSVMEIYFKAYGNNLVRGIGEMNTIGDSAYFTNPNAVTFPKEDALIILPCKHLPSIYQNL